MGLIEWVRRWFTPTRPTGASPFAPGAGPSRLVLLRHAEKTGDKRDPHLSAAGTERARRLVEFIPATVGRVDFLIAARTSKRSRRPVETLEPLAASLALSIEAELDDEEVDGLVRLIGENLKYRGRCGVVSWRHSDLPRLAKALGAPDLFEGEWHDDDYTSMVDLTYRGDGTARATRMKMPF